MTRDEQLDELHRAMRELRIALARSLGLLRFMNWLARRLAR
jgi:hypothetical protein